MIVGRPKVAPPPSQPIRHRAEVFPTAPTPECIKCGHPRGFALSEPRYIPSDLLGSGGRERLEWECGFCGYAVLTEVAPTIGETS